MAIDFKRLSTILPKLRGQNILVIGDLMIDEYLWGKVERISPEAPVEVVEIEKEDRTLGGAGNVVKNLVSLHANVYIGSVIDAGRNGDLILTKLERLGVPLNGLFKDSSKISSVKTRIISSENNQQILRLDRETRTPINKENEDKIINFVEATMNKCGAVIISDYMKGVLTERVLRETIQLARDCNVATIVDPKGDNYQKYCGATVITPNKREIAAALGIMIKGEDELRKAGKEILTQLDAEAILITRGKEGMTLFQRDKEVIDIPTRAKEVYDVTGAGDTVVSVLGVGIASGLSFEDAAEIANIAAGIVVGKVGTATVSIEELLEYEGPRRAHAKKLKQRRELKTLVEQERLVGKTIVFVNGCFDLLHVGHVKLLEEAKSLGDVLVVGVNSDKSVRRLKGDKRPVMTEEERARMLTALDCVDYVTIFQEDTPLKLIKELKPDILVKGRDYKRSEVIGREVVESYGGRVELLELMEGISTSSIIARINKR